MTLAACSDFSGNSSIAEAQRPPPDVCEGARKALRGLSEKGVFAANADGTATISQEAWLSTSDASRASLADALGYEAACNSSDPKTEQEVVITNEFGQVLMRRLVPVVPDLPGLNPGLGYQKGD
jgi:hypothetical protein